MPKPLLFKDKQGAEDLHALLDDMLKLIGQGRDLVNKENFSKKDSVLYHQIMGKVIGDELYYLYYEIWRAHPELIPEGVKPIAFDGKPKKRKRKTK